MKTRLVPLMLLGYCLLFACKPGPPDAILFARKITTHHFFTVMDSVQIRHCLDTLLQGTAYQGKLSVNQPFNANALNVYLLNGNSARFSDDPDFKSVIGNCSFIGAGIIVIDVAYLNSFLPAHHVDTVNESMFNMKNKTCFLYWTLGHELGHFFNNQPHSHYDSGYLDNFVKSADIENRQELQADSFFVSVISKDKHLRTSVETTLLTMLNAEIVQKVGEVKTPGVGLLYDYSSGAVLEYSRQPVHPEFVIRLARMLELSAKKSGEDGFYHLIAGFINHLKEKPSPK